VEAVAEVREDGGPAPRVEGDVESGWVLVDHGSVVTHIFSAEKRQFYRLEDVWQAARVVVRLQ
jgi:ribosome-associated protein